MNYSDIEQADDDADQFEKSMQQEINRYNRLKLLK